MNHSTSPLFVALVSAASAFPIFLLGFPSGALIDTLYKPTCLLLTQIWALLIACASYLFLSSENLNPYILLSLVFANALSVAFRGPVVAALTAEYVPPQQMSSAIAMNSVSMNLSRVIGPMIAGAVISTASAQAVFLLNAALSFFSTVVLLLNKNSQTKPAAKNSEGFFTALRVGIQFFQSSEALKSAIFRIFLFACMTTAAMSMLPLISRTAQNQSLSNAAAYTSLLLFTGLGALLAVLCLKKIRDNFSNHSLIIFGTLVQAIALILLAISDYIYQIMPLMLVIGFSMLVTGNSLSLRAQLSLPQWIKARGMALYQMATMGGTFFGALIWGGLAAHANIGISLVTSALVCSAGIIVLSWRTHLDDQFEDLTLVPRAEQPRIAHAKEGQVIVQIEYRIKADVLPKFILLMESSRASRLRKGAIHWKLTNDWQDEEIYIEEFTDRNLNDHLRGFDRVTAQDMVLRGEKIALHSGSNMPQVRRFFKVF